MTALAHYQLLIDAGLSADPEAQLVVEVERLDLGAFYADNDLDPEDVNAIGALAVGADYVMGGGASPIFVVRRVA